MSTFDSVQDRDLLPVYTVSQQSSYQWRLSTNYGQYRGKEWSVAQEN